MSQESDEAIAKILSAAQDSPQVLKMLTQNILKNSPQLKQQLINEALKGSHHPYFNPMSGMIVRDIADAMIADGLDREILWEDYPHYTEETLRQKLLHGRKYLVECMDTDDGKYKKWRLCTEFTKIREGGTVIGMLIGMKKGDEKQLRFIPRIARDRKEVRESIEGEELALPPSYDAPPIDKSNEAWRPVVQNFILSEEKVLVIKDIVVNAEDKAWLMGMLTPIVDTITAKISSVEIKIIRTSMKIEGDRISIL